MEWRPIEEAPESDVAVLLYFANLKFKKADGSPSEMGLVRDLTERCEAGFYLAEHSMWCESGTGHDVFECWKDENYFPTHWMPLPLPPGDVG